MNTYRNQHTGITIRADRAPTWGGTWDNLTTPNETQHTTEPEQSDSAAPAEEPQPATQMPAPTAHVKTWVEFMAKNNIAHPADATRKEMREIAAKHFRDA